MMQSLNVVVVLVFLTGVTAEGLKFPDAYYAKGTIYLPYGDIAEPFEAWVDMKSGNSRLDAYYGERVGTATQPLGREIIGWWCLYLHAYVQFSQSNLQAYNLHVSLRVLSGHYALCGFIGIFVLMDSIFRTTSSNSCETCVDITLRITL